MTRARSTVPTKRQLDVLCFVHDVVQATEFAPTYREIGEEFDTYPSVAHEHVARLELAGCLVSSGACRGITVTARGRRLCARAERGPGDLLRRAWKLADRKTRVAFLAEVRPKGRRES